MGELKCAINFRKECLMPKEMEALARCWNVPIDKIPSEELERVVLPTVLNQSSQQLRATTKVIKSCNQNKENLLTHAFGRIPQGEDLLAIIKRANLNISNLNNVEFGDNDNSENSEESIENLDFFI